ncbi:MAG TPA: LptF/LptG family permease [Pyrinomonadaceae bacterium]|nr:LptF/LptG family permease [Pyrinomonadaceae bacterium]
MFPRQIDRYIVGALVPYTALSLLILTAVLLTQQAARFAEVLGAADASPSLVLEVVFNLLPNILIFSLPMSVLTGTATGFSRLGSDSELVAIRAAGVGTWRMLWPALLYGACLCLVTLYVGFVWAPAAARNLSEVALRAALRKMESPVEPRSFYTGMPGKVVYVRDGDREKGQWGRVFMHWLEPGGQARLVTAASGRLDTSGEQTELVLEEAVITTLPPEGAQGPEAGVTTEHSARLRIRDERLSQARNLLIRRMREREPEHEEMNWGELRARTRVESDKDRVQAEAALHRRLSMSLAPLAFILLGGSFGLRIGRGGRSVGVLSSLAALVLYYLVALLGEQMWRAGVVPPVLGAWLAFGLSILAGLFLIASYRRHFTAPLRLFRVGPRGAQKVWVGRGRRRTRLLGLLDRSIITSLAQNFLVVLLSLVAIFFIFTLFELLRFIAVGASGASLVVRYLFFLLPYVCVAVTPVSMLLAVLITFALLARRSEAISWWASGQSVYRLLLPCFLCAACVGGALWAVQEKLMPGANRRQNALRAQIRGGGLQSEPQTGRLWLASGDTRRVYSYVPGGGGRLVAPAVFDFDERGVHLRRIVSGEEAGLAAGTKALEVRGARVLELGGPAVGRAERGAFELEVADPEVFKYELNKPAELDARELSAYIKTLKRNDRDAQTLAVALERKRAEPFSPLVMALVGAPLALAFGRRSAVTALCAAVFLALTFLGVTSGLQQVGGGGLLPPAVAAWSPIFIFAAVGVYFLTRAKT